MLKVKVVLLWLESWELGNLLLFFLLVEAVIPRNVSQSCCLVLRVCQIVELNQISKELDKEIRKLLVSFLKMSWSCLYWSRVIVPWISKSIVLYILELKEEFCVVRICIISFGEVSVRFKVFRVFEISLVRVFCGL